VHGLQSEAEVAEVEVAEAEVEELAEMVWFCFPHSVLVDIQAVKFSALLHHHREMPFLIFCMCVNVKLLILVVTLVPFAGTADALQPVQDPIHY
jgi:hypothetical protein